VNDGALSSDGISEVGSRRGDWPLTSVVVVCLALLPFLFFFPATLGRAVLGDQDAIFYFFPAYRLVAEQLRSFHFPLWNPYVYSGMPLFAAWQAGVLDPLNWVFLLLGVTGRSLSFVQQLTFSVALVSTFLYARSVGMMRKSAVVVAIIYCLSGFLVARTLYPGLLHAAALTPLLLYCIERVSHPGTDARAWKFVALGSLVLAWEIFAGHPQPVVYAALLGLSYALFRRSLHGLLIFVGGIGVGAIQWLPAWEVGRESVRGVWTFEMYAQHSLNPISFLVAIIPFFHGGGRGIYAMPYWGEYWHHVESQSYLGFVALSLAIAGAFVAWRKRESLGIYWSIVGLVAALLAMGKYFLPLAYLVYHIPVLGNFRSPNRHWMEVSLACAVLAGLAVDRILRNDDRIVGSIAVVTALVLTILAAIVGGYVLLKAQWPGASAEFWMPIVTGLVSLVALAFCVKLRAPSIIVVVLLLDFCVYASFAPIWSASRPEAGLGAARPKVMDVDSRAHLQLEAGSGEFDPRLYYGVRMASGYDPLVSARYKEFTGINEAGHSHLKTLLDEDDRTLDVLNVKYVIAEQGFRDQMRAKRRWREVDEGVFENLNVLPAAWFEVSPGDGWDSIRSIRGEQPAFTPYEANAVIGRTAPSSIEIDVTTERSSTLVLSETYWPGWHAKVDGKAAPIKRVNYILRGINLEPGSHHIVMWYWPWTMTAGIVISGLTLLSLAILILVKPFRAFL